MLRTVCAALLPLALTITASAQTAKPKTVTAAEAASHILQNTPPAIPPLAKAAKLGGTVKLRIVISPKGDVSQANAISGHPMLVQAALDAVRTWKYKPFLENGFPIAVTTDVDVEFPNELSPEQAQDKYSQTQDECRNLLKGGRYAAAEERCREAIKMADAMFQDRVLERSIPRSLLANALFMQRRIKEAVPLYEEALALDQGGLKPNDADLATDYENLGRAYVKMGELAKADPLYSRSVSTFEAAIQNLPSMKENYTQRLKRALNEYADLKEAEGDTQAAEELRKKAAGL